MFNRNYIFNPGPLFSQLSFFVDFFLEPSGPAGRVPAFTWRADGKVHRTVRAAHDGLMGI